MSALLKTLGIYRGGRGVRGGALRLFLTWGFLFASFLATGAWANGTASQTSITNGVFVSGDTVPQASGRLSIAYKISNALGDSRYVGFNSTGSVVVVDTAYDIDTIPQPANKTGYIGDTISYAYTITNLGNATYTIYFDSIFHPAGQGDSGPSSVASTNWNISGSYKVYYDLNNDGLWASGDTSVTSIVLSAGATDTVILVVIIPADANSGETTTASIMVTDRAPLNNRPASSTGDGWEDSIPIRSNDLRDTQYDTTVTTVSGPNVIISKSISEQTGNLSRPGDTLIIAISFDNDGTDSARGLEIMDAIPSNTRFVRNSADSVELPYQWSFGSGPYTYSDTAFRVYYETDVLGSALDFKDTFTPFGSNTPSAEQVSAVRWSLNQPVGATNGDAVGSINVDLSKNDNGRVYFRLVIK